MGGNRGMPNSPYCLLEISIKSNSPTKNWGGSPIMRGVVCFKSWRHTNGMFQIPAKGPWFTWSNNWRDSTIKCDSLDSYRRRSVAQMLPRCHGPTPPYASFRPFPFSNYWYVSPSKQKKRSLQASVMAMSFAKMEKIIRQKWKCRGKGLQCYLFKDALKL